MMISETEEDIRREKKAIELFSTTFGFTFQKLSPQNYYKVFNAKGELIAYAEVKGRIRTMRTAYPLPISANKLTDIFNKRMPPIVIWSCEDGIIYGKANKLKGEIKVSDSELIVYYDRQKPLRYIRFT